MESDSVQTLYTLQKSLDETTNQGPVCIRMHKDLTHVKDPVVHTRVRWTMETLNPPKKKTLLAP